MTRAKQAEELNSNALPQHVAVIMDGNGRWAKKRFLPRAAGHTAGMRRVKSIMIRSSELGIRYLTLYAFSTENWKRPEAEVSFLMNLVIEYLKKELQAMCDLDIRIRTEGDISALPSAVVDMLELAKEQTKDNKGLTVNLALNYGSRAEIAQTAADLARECAEGSMNPDEITEELFTERMGASGVPDPDLVIRTSGEQRLSNFLLYQLAYAELYFTPVLWPDFDDKQYDAALLEYQKRSRRFGGVW